MYVASYAEQITENEPQRGHPVASGALLPIALMQHDQTQLVICVPSLKQLMPKSPAMLSQIQGFWYLDCLDENAMSVRVGPFTAAEVNSLKNASKLCLTDDFDHMAEEQLMLVELVPDLAQPLYFMAG